MVTSAQVMIRLGNATLDELRDVAAAAAKDTADVRWTVDADNKPQLELTFTDGLNAIEALRRATEILPE